MDKRINNTRIEEEKAVVEQMIRLYCRKYEGHDDLCPSCKELLDYAHSRLDRCRFGEQKTTCKKCPVHCYRPEMKERIRMVMRWSGPRMIIYHPIAASKHLMRSKTSCNIKRDLPKRTGPFVSYIRVIFTPLQLPARRLTNTDYQ